MADELKKRQVPVIVGPIMTLPQERYDPYDAPFACPAKLHAAGVRFCIRSAGTTNTRNLPYEAAMAASYGLPPEEALKAVTLYPAQILGVADQTGQHLGGQARQPGADQRRLAASVHAGAGRVHRRPAAAADQQAYTAVRALSGALARGPGGTAPLGTK